jgi:hypothetical protein
MEIEIPKSSKQSRINELITVNKLNGIKQTQKELRAMSYDELNRLLEIGYDKAFGTGFKMSFK